jgi:ribosome-binding factor A
VESQSLNLEVLKEWGADPEAMADAMFGGETAPVDRKTQQLCRQVERVLGMLFAGELADDVLCTLTVMDVLPAPNASRLQVLLTPSGDLLESEESVRERLEKARPFLRSQVAQAIQRKKAPELLLALVPRVQEAE